MKNLKIPLFVSLILLPVILAFSEPEITGELKKWHKITLTFDGPEVSETDEVNPFLNYRLDVVFKHKEGEKTYKIPGYFAADGNAAETSADSGNKWRVHFAPDEIGTWTWEATFLKGNYMAVRPEPRRFENAGYMHGAKGTLEVSETDKTGRDMRAKGRLQYIGEHYLRFAGNREYFMKNGADAPENLLAYVDFDGDFDTDGYKDHFVKTWEPHVKDWNAGDPTWQGGKGKGLIGAINYLKSEGLNSFSFLTLNIKGDDDNVFPYIDYYTYDRFDVSKLAQWEIIFEHGTKNGFFLHFKTLEAENQGLLDNGGVGAQYKLYFRELVARFGHHPALNWNIAEESGDWTGPNQTRTLPQDSMTRIAMAHAIDAIDPYDHHIVIHNGIQYYDLLGDRSKLTGISLQTHRRDFGMVYSHTRKWREYSAASGRKWAVAVDEPGDAQYSLVPDSVDPDKFDARTNALWGAYLAGAWGIEWYFGYANDESDLTCQDFRSRDLFWDQCRHALTFFHDNEIDFWNYEPADSMFGRPKAYNMRKGYDSIIGMITDTSGDLTIRFGRNEGSYKIEWYDPRNGGDLQKGSVATIEVNKPQQPFSIGNPPSDKGKDWVVLVTRQ